MIASALPEAAIKYAAKGFHVLPVAPRGKVPLTRRGLHDATLEPARLADWWGKWPHANVGIRTGSVSQLVVLDVDGELGADSLRELEREHGPLPPTASTVTPGGGSHYLFRHPGSLLPSSVGRLGPGVDVRADNAYAVMPPSIGANGRRYEVDAELPLAPLPAWIALDCRRHVTSNGRVPPEEWLRLLRGGIAEGSRNDALARLTGHLLRRDVNAYVGLELVLAANAVKCKPPLAQAEVERIVDSIAGAELRRRRGAA